MTSAARRTSGSTCLITLRYDDLANVAMRTSMDAAAEKMSFNHYVMRLGKALEGQVYAQKVRDFLLRKTQTMANQNFAAYNEAVKSSSQDMDRKVDYAKWYADTGVGIMNGQTHSASTQRHSCI